MDFGSGSIAGGGEGYGVTVAPPSSGGECGTGGGTAVTLGFSKHGLEAAEGGVKFVVSLLFVKKEIGFGAGVGEEIVGERDHVGEFDAEGLPGGSDSDVGEAGDGEVEGAGELGPFGFFRDEREEGRFRVERGAGRGGDVERAGFSELMVGQSGREAGGGFFVVTSGEENSAGGEAELRRIEDAIAEGTGHTDGVGEVVLIEVKLSHGEADLIELIGREELRIDAQILITFSEVECGGIIGGAEGVADAVEEDGGVVGGEEINAGGIEFDGAGEGGEGAGGVVGCGGSEAISGGAAGLGLAEERGDARSGLGDGDGVGEGTLELVEADEDVVILAVEIEGERIVEETRSGLFV